MIHTIHLSLAELKDYISWPYFYHAWGIPVRQYDSLEAVQLQKDALNLIERLSGEGFQAHFRFRLFPAGSQGDDLILINSDLTSFPSWETKNPREKDLIDSRSCIRVPFLRQQRAPEGKPCLCLSDFVRPFGKGAPDAVGFFAATVDGKAVSTYQEDDFMYMLSQTVCDRLAEAASEYGHQEVRRHLWGYAPEEDLSVPELLQGRYQGIRPAIGYPCLPDQSLNFLLAELLDFSSLGITLSENGAMLPHASVSGLMFSHPLARYFDVGTIGEDQLTDYAERRHLDAERLKDFLRVVTS